MSNCKTETELTQDGDNDDEGEMEVCSNQGTGILGRFNPSVKCETLEARHISNRPVRAKEV